MVAVMVFDYQAFGDSMHFALMISASFAGSWRPLIYAHQVHPPLVVFCSSFWFQIPNPLGGELSAGVCA